MKISVLDCTLRDGGYINNWKFPLNQIIRLLESLDKSNVDIVELGYLNDKSEQDIDSTLFESIEHIEILRFLDLGYKVKMQETNSESISVDIPEDVIKVENFLNQKNHK